MARGFLAGAVAGIVVSGLGAGVLSLATGVPEDVRARVLPTPSPSQTIAAPVTDAEDMPSPDVPAEEDVVAVVPAEESAPEVPAIVPEAPASVLETTDSVDEAPDAAPAPDVGESPDAPRPPVEPEPDTQVTVTGEAPVAPPAAVATPPEPAAEDEPEVAEDAPPPVETDMTEVPAPVTLEPEEAPELASEDPEDASDRPSIGTPAGSLADRAPAVAEGRLPTIGAEADAPPATEEPEAPETVDDPLGADSPLIRFASPFTPQADVPRMALILIDDGSGPMGPKELETFPFPVSFAISPAHPDPTGAAEGYRERGFEVLALADMPEGAVASDVEVSLTGLFDAIPEAVGVLEDPSGGLQDSREVSMQAAAFLGSTGHGLVMVPKGLNTAQKLAAKEGVPSATLFRDLDGDGQDQGLIRRTLDQAAFRARQEGAVVMLGRLRADTISALLLWGLQDRGNTIELVPISTVLKESLVPAE